MNLNTNLYIIRLDDRRTYLKLGFNPEKGYTFDWVHQREEASVIVADEQLSVVMDHLGKNPVTAPPRIKVVKLKLEFDYSRPYAYSPGPYVPDLDS